ncbi:hypothetical protein LCGC14_3002830, partial [marine sediment metagenome]
MPEHVKKSNTLQSKWFQSLSDDDWFRWCDANGVWWIDPDEKELSHTPDRIYFAYGSNLHKAQMMTRCRDAVPMQSV